MNNCQNREGTPSSGRGEEQGNTKPVMSVQIQFTDGELTDGPEELSAADLEAILKRALLQAREEAAAHLPDSSTEKVQVQGEIRVCRKEHPHVPEAGDSQGSLGACAQHSPIEESGHGHGEGHTHGQELPSWEGHVHGKEDFHEHGHTHPNSKAVSNRLAKAIGHLESVKRMVDRGDDCADILIQLAAVRSAINNAGKVLLIDHLNHCIVDAVEDGDLNAIDDFSDAIWKFVK